MTNMKMLYFDRIDVSKGTDVNKTSKSKKCDICYYLYFLNKGFKLQPYVCNRCNDLLMMSVNLSDIATLKTKNADCRCFLTGISKSKALLQNINFTGKSGTL